MTGMSERIEAIRREQGKQLLILGHHYQRPEVLKHADATGDSLELSRNAASAKDAQRIVFCGVHFMAESADILTAANQSVYMPCPDAGCPMADMAWRDEVEQAWRLLQASAAGEWLPVVYVNSSAEIKALCGEWGGSACTSSNCAKVFKWVFDRKKRVFFLPDEHLGTNTAFQMGLEHDEVAVFDPAAENGGLSPAAIRRARVIVWKGFCHVHTLFSVDNIRQVRRELPDAKIIVHPETPREVVRLADASGSTSQIIKCVHDAADGSTIVIGTEAHLVQRLADEGQGRVTIKALWYSMCPNMHKITEANLLQLLETWPESARIKVPEPVAASARLALDRMLAL